MPLSLEKTTSPISKDRKGDLPETREEWVKYVTDLHDRGLSNRLKYEFQWVLNLAYFKGYQNLVFDRRSGTIQVPHSASQPLTINRLASFVESRHAKLTKNRPYPQVLPNTSDPEDKNAAKFSAMAVRTLWEKEDLEEEYDILALFGLLCGTSFMRTLWNPFIGSVIEKEVISEEGVMEADPEQIFMGEVNSVALSAFNIIPGSDSVFGIKKQPWIMERTWHPISDLEKFYPHLKDKIKSSVDSDKTEYEKIIDRLSSPTSASIGSSLTKITDSLNGEVLVKTLWIRPNPQYKNGIVCVVVGSELAHLGQFPHDYGQNVYPFSKFDEKPDGFHFWSQCSIERIMSIQRAYNRLKQKKLKSVYAMANQKWMVPKGAQLQEGALSDEEDEVVEYNSNVPEPHQAALGSIPNYAIELARELIVDMRDAGGQRETSITPPTNLTAGVAIQIAAELSDEILNPIIRRLGRCMKITATQQLILMQEEYIEPRQIRILGSGNEVGYQWIKAADFRHHTDVHIEIESLFPDFRGAKQQRLLDLWDRRIIQDPAQFLKAFRAGDLNGIMEEIEKVEDTAIMEVMQIKDGALPEISAFMDHGASFRVLSQWMASPEFHRLSPDRKQVAAQALQAHLQFLMPAQGPGAGGRNPNSVATPFGDQVPSGQAGNVGPQR